MNHAEIVFEPGSKSVVSYDNEQELKDFIQEHHSRALAGEAGGPTGHPAERVTKVLLYDQHPANWGAGGRVWSDKTKELIDGMTQDNSFDLHQLTTALRDEVSPVFTQDQGRHESLYKMKETGELDLSFLNEGDE